MYDQLLFLVTITGHIDVVRLLVAKEAEINLTDKDSQHALHLACFYGKQEVTSLLLHSGADVNLQDSQGHLPVDVAMEMGNSDIVQIIQEFQRTHSTKHEDVHIEIQNRTPQSTLERKQENKGLMPPSQEVKRTESGRSNKSKRSTGSRGSKEIDQRISQISKEDQRKSGSSGAAADPGIHESAPDETDGKKKTSRFGKLKKSLKSKRHSGDPEDRVLKKCCVIC